MHAPIDHLWRTIGCRHARARFQHALQRAVPRLHCRCVGIRPHSQFDNSKVCAPPFYPNHDFVSSFAIRKTKNKSWLREQVDRLKVKFGLKISPDEPTVNNDEGTNEPAVVNNDGTPPDDANTELPSLERQSSHDSGEQTPTMSKKRKTKPRRI